MLQASSNPGTSPEKNYEDTRTALMRQAALYVQAGYSPKAIEQVADVKTRINNFKTARELLLGKETPETVNGVVEQTISQGIQKFVPQINQYYFTESTASSTHAMKGIAVKNVAVVADTKPATPNMKYKPRKGEGLTAIAAQQPLVATAKEAVCNGKTDDRSAELVTAIAIARHNPEVKQIDLIRADLPLNIPNVAEFEQYVTQIKQTGLLANCHIGYGADVQGRNVADFFPAQRAPVHARQKAASK